jgi:hypothetical protein
MDMDINNVNKHTPIQFNMSFNGACIDLMTCYYQDPRELQTALKEGGVELEISLVVDPPDEQFMAKLLQDEKSMADVRGVLIILDKKTIRRICGRASLAWMELSDKCIEAVVIVMDLLLLVNCNSLLGDVVQSVRSYLDSDRQCALECESTCPCIVAVCPTKNCGKLLCSDCMYHYTKSKLSSGTSTWELTCPFCRCLLFGDMEAYAARMRELPLIDHVDNQDADIVTHMERRHDAHLATWVAGNGNACSGVTTTTSGVSKLFTAFNLDLCASDGGHDVAVPDVIGSAIIKIIRERGNDVNEWASMELSVCPCMITDNQLQFQDDVCVLMAKKNGNGDLAEEELVSTIGTLLNESPYSSIGVVLRVRERLEGLAAETVGQEFSRIYVGLWTEMFGFHFFTQPQTILLHRCIGHCVLDSNTLLSGRAPVGSDVVGQNLLDAVASFTGIVDGLVDSVLYNVQYTRVSCTFFQNDVFIEKTSRLRITTASGQSEWVPGIVDVIGYITSCDVTSIILRSVCEDGIHRVTSIIVKSDMSVIKVDKRRVYESMRTDPRTGRQLPKKDHEEYY